VPQVISPLEASAAFGTMQTIAAKAVTAANPRRAHSESNITTS
jgi:hypothetical protein